jgi:putative addiction module component (TIGR02574 family)
MGAQLAGCRGARAATLVTVSTAKKLYDEALKLPERERRDLAQRLLESVGDESAEVDRAWVEVAQGRLEDVQAGRTQLVPWAEARQRIFARG